MQNTTSPSFVNPVNASAHSISNEAGELSTATTAMYWTVLLFQIVLMIGMGAVTTIQEIQHQIKKSPIGILIALASQIALLPVCTFGLIYVMQLSGLHSISPMLVTLCLGGTVSTPYVYCCDGDVSLSIVLATVATVLGIGMTPLNLWVYSLPWLIADVRVPYARIAATFACLLLPLIAGMVIKIVLPNVAPVIAKVSCVVGMLMCVATPVLQYLANPDAYQQPLELWFLSWAIPVFGFVIGYILAWILRQTHRLAKTIAIETSATSIGVALVVIMTTFPPEIYASLTPFACICHINLVAGGIVLAAIVRLQKCQLKSSTSSEEKCEEICLVDI